MLLGGGTERKVAFVFHCRRSCRLPSSNFPSVCMDLYRVNVYFATLPSRSFILLNSYSILTVWYTFCLLEHCSTFRSVVGLFLLRFNVTSSILCDNWFRYSKNCEACVLIDTSLGEIGDKILGMKLLWNSYSDYLVKKTKKFRLYTIMNIVFLWSIPRCKFTDKKKQCVELVSSKLHVIASSKWIRFYGSESVI